MIKTLTAEQQAAFEEVEEKGIVRIPARNKLNEKGEEVGWNGENRRQISHFKSLVYKDLISFAIDFEKLDYLFVSHKQSGKKY